jgi:hypothetical protein
MIDVSIDNFLRPNQFWKLPEITLNDEQVKMFIQGQYVWVDQELSPFQWILDQSGQSCGLGVVVLEDGQEKLKVEVNFY